MKLLLALSVILASSVSFAGESGFYYQGKKYVVYREGKKVGKTFAELGLGTEQSAERKPAGNISSGFPYGAAVGYESTASYICFLGSYSTEAGIALSCLKK